MDEYETKDAKEELTNGIEEGENEECHIQV